MSEETVDLSETQEIVEQPTPPPKRRGRPPGRMAKPATPPPPSPRVETEPCIVCGNPSTKVLAYSGGPELDVCEDDDCARNAYSKWQETPGVFRAVHVIEDIAEEILAEEIPAGGDNDNFLPVARHPEITPAFGPYADGLGLTERFPTDLTYEEYVEVGRRVIAPMGTGMLWCLGDYINSFEHKHGEKYAGVVDDLGYELSTCQNAVQVCARFPRAKRHADLTYSHHAEVAYLDEAEREGWLLRAEQEKWTKARLRQEISASKMTGKPAPSTKPPTKKSLEKQISSYAMEMCKGIELAEAIVPVGKKFVDAVNEHPDRFDLETFNEWYPTLLKLRDMLQELVLDGTAIKRLFE